MSSIPLSIELGTMISVFGSAIFFFYIQRKTRLAAIRTQRIDRMSKICEDLSEIVIKGVGVRNKVIRAQAGLKVDVTVEDFTLFVQEILDYIEVNIACKFETWATPEEKIAINNIAEKALSWHNELVDFAINRPEKPAPDFSLLVNEIKEEIHGLSKIVRLEYEKID